MNFGIGAVSNYCKTQPVQNTVCGALALMGAAHAAAYLVRAIFECEDATKSEPWFVSVGEGLFTAGFFWLGTRTPALGFVMPLASLLEKSLWKENKPDEEGYRFQLLESIKLIGYGMSSSLQAYLGKVKGKEGALPTVKKTAGVAFVAFAFLLTLRHFIPNLPQSEKIFTLPTFS